VANVEQIAQVGENPPPEAHEASAPAQQQEAFPALGQAGQGPKKKKR